MILPPDDPALAAAMGLPATPANLQRLAREFGDERARLAVQQWELRRRAKARFGGLADQMLFTPSGLDMATHPAVARLHASLMDGRKVWDATCGIGADLIAFAQAGEAGGSDIDPDAVACARHNLTVWGAKAELEVADALELKPRGWSLFADPARREGRTRTLDPESFLPPLSRLVGALTEAPAALLKLSPMLSDQTLDSLGGVVRFVSHDRECREALVSFGLDGSRGALLSTGEFLPSGREPRQSEDPGSWVHEADPAGVRASALGTFGLSSLGDVPGWLTSDATVEANPWLRSHRVLWHGAWRPKTVQAELRSLGAKLAAVKTRGVKADPAAVQKSLKPGGDVTCVLMLYTVGPSVRAALVEPPP